MGKPKAINRDVSKRLYMSDAEYPEHIRRTSDKAKDIQYKEKHSEFKKPWGPGESFPEMEYWLDPLPGFDPWIFDFPETDLPPDPRIEGGGELTVLYCRPYECYNDNAETCILPNCTYPVTGVALAGSYPGFSVNVQGGLICITAPEEASPAIELNIFMKGKSPDGRTVTGSHGSVLIEKCDDCADPPAFAWDNVTSPETIDVSDSATVAVTGGVAPYDWEVTGTGATLAVAQTAGLSNTLNTSAGACGPIIITVTDACGQVATGYVRCTNGDWDTCGGPSGDIYMCNVVNTPWYQVLLYFGLFRVRAYHKCYSWGPEADCKCLESRCQGTDFYQYLCADDVAPLSCGGGYTVWVKRGESITSQWVCP